MVRSVNHNLNQRSGLWEKKERKTEEGNSVSFPCPSSYLHLLPDDDDDLTPLLSPHNAAPGGSGGDDGVRRGVTHTRLHEDTQSDDDDDGPADTIEELLGLISQRKDTGCDDDGVDVSVGVGVGARVGVGVSCLGVCLEVCLGVGLVVDFPPPTSIDSYGARLRAGSLTNYYLPSWWGSPFNKHSFSLKKVFGANIHETQGLLERMFALPHAQ